MPSHSVALLTQLQFQPVPEATVLTNQKPRKLDRLEFGLEGLDYRRTGPKYTGLLSLQQFQASTDLKTNTLTFI